MPVRPRGNTFQVDVKVRDAPRWRGTAATQDAADQIEAQVRADLLAGRPVSVTAGGKSPQTLGPLRDRVMTAVWKGTKSETTSAKNARAAVEYFGTNQVLSGITAEKIDEYIEYLRGSGNAPGTINRKLAALSRMLRYAKQRGWLENLPYIERQKEKKGRLRFFSLEEEKAIIADAEKCGYAEYAMLFTFLIDTGLRKGEALKLEWPDIKTANGKTSVHVWDSKNGGERFVPLTDRAREQIEWRRTQYAGSSEPKVWPFTEWQVRHVWDMVRNNLGQDHDEEWVPHTLRHTFASRLVQKGIPILTVKELMGHESIQTTMRYAHLHQPSLEDAIQCLNAA